MEPSTFTIAGLDDSYRQREDNSWGLASAFEPSSRLLQEGPWLDFPTLAAWVEHVYESLSRELGRASKNVERYEHEETGLPFYHKDRGNYGPGEESTGSLQQSMAKGFKLDSAAEASRLANDIDAFLATVGPTGATYGAILDEVRSREERESSRDETEVPSVREETTRKIGAAFLREYSDELQG